jgi:capsular exopolysaccharide synthesis family protein
MSNITPAVTGPQTAIEPYAPSYPPAPYRGGGDDPGGEEQGLQLSRVVSALGRYKWLVLVVVAIGTVGGIVATRYLDPEYRVDSTVLLTGDQTRSASLSSGPIRVEQEFDPQGWIDLLRSFAIADSVVVKLALYVRPNDASDAPLFRDFTLLGLSGERNRPFMPGKYTLKVDGPRYTLHDAIGSINESGIVGDSIGRTAGFAWRPSKAALGNERTVKFTVKTPRETATDIIKPGGRLMVGLNRGSNIILLQLTGTVQEKPAETLNAWGEQFVRIATDLKTRRLSQFSKILNSQRQEAADRLMSSERELQQFRVAAITQPSEGTPIRPGNDGIELSRDPVLENYFSQKILSGNLRRDREQLERVAAQVTPTNTPVEAILSVQTVATDPIGEPLRNAVKEYTAREQDLRLIRQVKTDSHPDVRAKLAQMQALQAQIPNQLQLVLTQMKNREATVNNVITQSEKDLQGIPSRTIQEEALRREVASASQLYTSLQQRFAEAQLAEQSTIPDVRVLDTAVMPLAPTTNTVPKIIAAAIAASLALGLGLAVLLDRVDRRFRYPTQATKDLGLDILGVVPVVDQSRNQSPEKIAQIVEAFRSIRMNVRYACMPGTRVALTITSPGPNDGKSLVASNLALSFAEGGWRTVLIDGDLRRGQLNTTFDLPQTPGLVEYLEGTSLLGEVLYQTNHENLLLLPSGTRHRRGPELLATPRMQELLAGLGRDYDAIIVDTPPLGAGTDAYALGTATGNVAVVLRGAMTDVKMAQAKLKVLDHLPVRVIGAVLNGIETDGAYQYYSYDPEYAMVEEAAPVPQLTGSAGEH